MQSKGQIFALTWFCVAAIAVGAGAQTKSDTIRTDTVRNRYTPTGVRVGYDMINPVKTYVQDNFKGWELQADVDFDRYYLVVEYGNWGKNLASDSAAYANTGNYWRAGIDVNFLTKDPERNVFFLGARYGRSVFSETMSVMRYDPAWGHHSDTFRHSDVTASWVELTTGLKVKIWKMVWLGYTARFKFARSAAGSSEMLPYNIPGFGNTDKDTAWGFNYYLLVRLPLRKTPAPPAPK